MEFRKNKNRIIGIILIVINIYWLWHNLQLTYLYYYSSVLFLTMLSDWLLTLNIVFSLIGILVAIKVLRKKIDLKKGTVINLLLWLLEGIAYFFRLNSSHLMHHAKHFQSS